MWRHGAVGPRGGTAGLRKETIARPRRPLTVCNASDRQRTADERALERYLVNRVKRLGTLLPPPGPDAPQPDTAVLWSFLSRQLAEGISNEAEVIVRKLPEGGVPDAGAGKGKKAKGAAASRRGVVVSQPKQLPASGRTVPLPVGAVAPAAPAIPGSGSNSGSGGGLVHVFWDVESAHPADRDPRLVSAEVLRLARQLGARVAGAYAYATRPAWAWVPSRFVSAYADQEDSNGSSSSNNGSGGSSGGTVGGTVGAAPTVRPVGRPICPLCGRQVAAARMEGHIRQLHSDQPAATAASLAAAAVAHHEAAAAAGVGVGVVGDRAVKEAAAAVATGRAAAAQAKGKAGGGRTNTHRTGLGAVREYWSSSGECFRPPAGHQLGLKYVVAREGFEPRVVQNADGAADRALNGGVDRLLAALRNGRGRGGGGGSGSGGSGNGEVTLVIVSGSRRHAGALDSCRQLGVRTVLVAPRAVAAAAAAAAAGPGIKGGDGGGGGGADVALDWELLAQGAYKL